MQDTLSNLSPTLAAFSNGQLSLTDLASQWRQAAQAHQPALPARYQEVLERVLSQLESSALFTEESCLSARATWSPHWATGSKEPALYRITHKLPSEITPIQRGVLLYLGWTSGIAQLNCAAQYF